jgi:uncharacterized protein DUF1579
MRHHWTALGVVCFWVVAAAAQPPMPKPGPAQRRLEVFAGNWTFAGEFRGGTIGQGGKVTGTEANQMLGGFFVERHYKEKGPGGERRGLHVFGWDPVKKTYITSDFDSMGGFGSGTASVSGNTWTLLENRVGGGKPLRNRCVLKFSSGNRSYTVKCQVSTDGQSWTPGFEGRWTRTR